MFLENELYKVNISVDDTYTVDSADNKYYDIILNHHDLKRNDWSKTFCIEVDNSHNISKLALIGSFYSYDTNCAILNNSILTVLQDDVITQIMLSDYSMILCKRFDCFGCNYGIYQCDSGYIVHGEIDIMMLNNQFEKVWSFGGGDVFVLPSNSNKKSFEIYDNIIKLYDWEENYYEVDFTGKQINEL